MEKLSFEKTRQLLEVSEWERHYKFLLTLENISTVRHNPTPYTLPVIPRSLPSDVVEGEHFVIADLRCLVSGSARYSRDPGVEASSWVQGVGYEYRGHPLRRVGILVPPISFLVWELGIVVPTGSPRLCK